MESKDMTKRFRNRGYPNSIIKQAKLKVQKKWREIILGLEQDEEKANGTPPEKIGLVTTYGTHWDYLKNILCKHWHLLMIDNRFKQILGFYPNLIAKRTPTNR